MDGCNHSKNTGAEVLISPCGKFLYASNRGGFDSIVIFEIDQDSGMLKYIGYEHSRGEIPRFFMMDKSGELLLVANQDSDSLVLFSRNSSTGLLSYCGHLLGLERPTCIIEL
jgi:6-phosphogluconolactonase